MKQENKTPKKIGRPRVYKEIMSNRDRQQRWRDKVSKDAHEILIRIRESV